MADGLTYKEMIVQSAVAKRLISEVSPIYEDSYVGSWIFEILGRSWDRIWAIIDEMPEQLFPQEVTWLIDLWERRYAITPNLGDDLETRRRRLLEAEAPPQPFTPWALDRYVFAICGRHVNVDEHIADYTFGVYVVDSEDALPLDYSKIRKWIIKHKHSHMSFELYCETDAKIKVKTETMYWKFPRTLAGTSPYRNIRGAVERSEIEIETEGEGYPYSVSRPGSQQTGTQPRRNIIAAIERDTIEAGSSSQQHPFSYVMTGTGDTGEIPQRNITAEIQGGGLAMGGEATAIRYRHIPCGAISSGGDIL